MSVGNTALTRIIGILTAVLLMGGSAFGEILVQPIMLRQAVRPGRLVSLGLTLENISRDTMETVSLRLADLTQNEDGVWEEVRLDDPSNPVDVSSLRSCKDWLTCGIDKVDLDPYGRVPIPLVARIPPGTRGFYFAALIAKTEPRQTDLDGPYGGALMAVQYVVPIILEAQTIPVQAQVKLTGVHIQYVAATVENPVAAVIASMDIENKGGTYSRLQGQIRIWHEARGRWQKAADLTLPDNGIIPGVKLNLKHDVGMLLPDGKYKVEGYLYVDGRRANAISEEIDFKGDPRKPTVRKLVPIDLDKESVFVDVTPGSTRMGTILIANASEEPIKVNAEVILPEHMLNVVSGQGIKGEDLSCADWVTLQPSEFTLQPYGRVNLGTIIRMPPTATEYSNYYATLRLHVTYPDGTAAGTKIAQVCLRNGRVVGANAIFDRPMNTAGLSPSKYVVTAAFTNGGVTHVTPRCRGILTAVGGENAKYKQFLMYSEAEGQRGIFTPFETRTFSGILDVSDIPAGVYRVTAVLEYLGRSVQNQMISENTQGQLLIEVEEKDGHKTIKQLALDQAPDGQRGKVPIQL